MRDQQSRFMRASHVLMLFFVVAALILSVVGAGLGDAFYIRLGTEALILAGIGLSVDLLLGFTGVLSLGQALYFGIGAYASALVLLRVYLRGTNCQSSPWGLFHPDNARPCSSGGQDRLQYA